MKTAMVMIGCAFVGAAVMYYFLVIRKPGGTFNPDSHKSDLTNPAPFKTIPLFKTSHVGQC